MATLNEVDYDPFAGNTDSFKKEYYPAAERAGKQLGVSPDVVLGQWGEETSWGKKIIPGTNNLGNIKGPNGVSAKDNQTGSTDSYKKYKSTDEFADDYARLIKTRYPGAMGAGDDPQAFTKGLKGYAEDQHYPSKVQAASQAVANVPNPVKLKEVSHDPFAQTQRPATTKPDEGPKDKDYKSGSSENATFGESARDVGQAALGVGSSMAGGIIGTAAELGATIIPGINEPKPFGLGVDPYQLKNHIANALSYEPKTTGAKELANIASIPGRIVSAPTEALVNAAPESLKPTADVVGNALTAEFPRVAGEATRRVMTGNDAARADMRSNIAAFKRAGVDSPTVGQVSTGGLTGGAGAGSKLIEKQKADLAKYATSVADKMSSVKNPEEAGQIIREAITGTPETTSITTRKGATPQVVETGKKIGGYIDNARSMEESLYDEMYKKVGKDTKWGYPNLRKTLDDLTSQNPNLQSTSNRFINKGLLDLRERLMDDTGGLKQLGYEDARWLRNKIGQMTDPRSIVPGDTSTIQITPHQADALYAAMSEDMMNGVRTKGPKAELATLKANNFSRQLHNEIQTNLQPVMNAKLLKDVYDTATSGGKEGAERLKQTMKVMNKGQQDAVKSVFFRELGRQGDQWDMKTFMNNYGKLHADAKDTMFGGAGKSNYRNSLDAISKVADRLSVDENTWHKLKSFLLTQGKLGPIAATGAVAGLISHSTIGAFLAGPAAGFITGTLVRNPKFVDWFAKSASKTKPSSILPMLGQLQQREKDMSPEDQQETQDYIDRVQHELKTPDSGVPQ
jgi:hypothetical protein